MTYLEHHAPVFVAETVDLAYQAARFDARITWTRDGWVHPDGTLLDFDEVEALGLDGTLR